MAGFELVTRWSWKQNNLFVNLVDIVGPPSTIREEILKAQLPPLDNRSLGFQLGHVVASMLVAELPEIQPIDLGSAALIPGRLSDIVLMSSRDSRTLSEVYLSYEVTYSTAKNLRKEYPRTWTEDELTVPLRTLVRQIHREAHQHAMAWYADTYSQGAIQSDKWKSPKIGVMISHRGRHNDQASSVFEGLGAWGGGLVFAPWWANVDLQGNEIEEQCLKAVRENRVFIPLLCPDFFDGPIAAKEVAEAIRLELNDQSRLIIPIVIEGSHDAFDGQPIHGYPMLDGTIGLDAGFIEELAMRAVKGNRNPYR